MTQAMICLNSTVTRDEHACITCARPITDRRSFLIKLILVPDFRWFFFHLLGCEPCQLAIQDYNMPRCCTEAQRLLRSYCERSEHLE